MTPASGQLPLEFRTHGGRRVGAGRPKIPGSVSHRRRPPVSPRAPLHVTVRMRRHVWNLRAQRCFGPVHRALEAVRARVEAFRVTHFSVQGNHMHLVIEARDRVALANGMRALLTRIARALNAVMGRRGAVVAARFHARSLRTPTEVRNVVRYVLANHARHVPGARVGDPCSSGPAFTAWAAIGVPPQRVTYLLRAQGPPVSPSRAFGWAAERPLCVLKGAAAP